MKLLLNIVLIWFLVIRTTVSDSSGGGGSVSVSVAVTSIPMANAAICESARQTLAPLPTETPREGFNWGMGAYKTKYTAPYIPCNLICVDAGDLPKQQNHD